MSDFYKEDLAYIHHHGFLSYEEAVVDELLAQFKKRGLTEGTIVDLGCGGGRLLKMLSTSGFNLHGVDISPEFLRIAKALTPEADFQQGSVYEVQLPPCIAVTSIGEVLSYVFEESSHQDQLEKLFQHIYQQLLPDGLFLFDLIIKDDTSKIFSHMWRTGKNWAVLAETCEDPSGQFLKREIISFRDSGKGYQRSEEIHYQEIASTETIKDMLREIGFTVDVQHQYGNTNVASHRKVFYAFK